MNDAAEVLDHSRNEVRKGLSRNATLCVEALAGGTDNELRPVLEHLHALSAEIEAHLDKVRRVNEAVGQSPSPVAKFPVLAEGYIHD